MNFSNPGIDPRPACPDAHAAGTAASRRTRRHGRLLVRGFHRRSVHSISKVAASTQRRRLCRDSRRKRGRPLVVQGHRRRGDRRGVPGVMPGGRPGDADGVANGRSHGRGRSPSEVLRRKGGSGPASRRLSRPGRRLLSRLCRRLRLWRSRGCPRGERGGARHRGSRQHRRHRIRAARAVRRRRRRRPVSHRPVSHPPRPR